MSLAFAGYSLGYVQMMNRRLGTMGVLVYMAYIWLIASMSAPFEWTIPTGVNGCKSKVAPGRSHMSAAKVMLSMFSS